MRKLLLLVVLFTAFTSCRYLGGETGMFRDRGSDYATAAILPPMRVPDNLDSYTLDQLYVIPEQVAPEPVVFEEVPLPKPLDTGRREGIIIQSLGDNRWILIDATPAQVWPLVRDYWTQLQVILDYENPGSGIMDTAWVEVDSDPDTRHKYRITIEPGLHSGYSEIYVTHLENPRSDPIPTVVTWPEQSTSEDRESQILNSLSQYLADRNDIYQASSASLLAGSIETVRKANLVETGDGDQVLQLRIDYNRAWVQVRQALVDANVTIVDSDRDTQIINVRFSGLDSEEAPGFIGRLFGRNGNSEVAPAGFSVRLQEAGNVIEVVAEASDVTPDSDRLRAELLQAINENLT